MTDLRVVGWLLVVGAAIFFVGATMPPLARTRVWMLELNRYLRVIDRHRLAWIAHVWCFVFGVVLTAIAFTLLVPILWRGGDPGFGLAGAVTYAIVAVLWLAALAYRLEITLWAATTHLETGQAPAIYEPLGKWAGSLYEIYMVVALLAEASIGAGLLASGVAPTWVGYAWLVFGLLGAASFGFGFPRVAGMRSLWDMPLMIHVMPLVGGLAVLLGA